MTEGWAKELAAHGIRCQRGAAGLTDTCFAGALTQNPEILPLAAADLWSRGAAAGDRPADPVPVRTGGELRHRRSLPPDGGYLPDRAVCPTAPPC